MTALQSASIASGILSKGFVLPSALCDTMGGYFFSRAAIIDAIHHATPEAARHYQLLCATRRDKKRPKAEISSMSFSFAFSALTLFWWIRGPDAIGIAFHHDRDSMMTRKWPITSMNTLIFTGGEYIEYWDYEWRYFISGAARCSLLLTPCTHRTRRTLLHAHVPHAKML